MKFMFLLNVSLLALDLTSLLDRIQKPHVITGLILAVLGFAIILLAKRIAFVARKDKSKPVDNNNKLYITLKALGLVMLLVALIIMIFE